MSFNKKLLGYIVGLVLIISPIVPLGIAHAAGLVPECGKVIQVPKVDSTGKPVLEKGEPVMESVVAKQCDFGFLMGLINNVIDFLIFVIAPVLVALILVYAGFQLITSGGNSESRSKAKKMIMHAIFGFIIALAAWLIIHTIFSIVNADPCLNWLGNEIPDC